MYSCLHRHGLDNNISRPFPEDKRKHTDDNKIRSMLPLDLAMLSDDIDDLAPDLDRLLDRHAAYAITEVGLRFLRLLCRCFSFTVYW